MEWRPAGLTFTSLSNAKFVHANPSNWRGVVVAEVAPGSPADWNGIEPGDIMTAAGSFETKSLAELESLLKTQGHDYSTKIVGCNIVRFSPRGMKQLPAQLNLAVNAQPKPSGPVSDTTAAQPTKTLQTNTSPPSASTDKSALRYDGKTFDEWRNEWRTELSTEKRLEAVKALAAFGANGYGREAAAEILDIAGEYDWRQSGNPLSAPEGELQKTILAALTGGDPAIPQIPVQFWLPVLLERGDAIGESARLKALAKMARITPEISTIACSSV